MIQQRGSDSRRYWRNTDRPGWVQEERRLDGMAAQNQSPVVMHGTHQAPLSATPSHLAPTPTIQNPQGMVEEPRNYTRSHDHNKTQQLAKMFEETLKNQQIILRCQGQQGKWQKQTQPDKQGRGK